MRHSRPVTTRRQRGGALRGLLLFVAGALLGANIVYYLVQSRPHACECAAPPPGTPADDTRSAPMAPAPGRPARAAAAPANLTPSPSGLVVPVSGVQPADLVDTYTQSRSGGRLHDAIDIAAPAGTPVVAAVEGRVVKLFESAAGGITLYQFDREERHVYYYAHLQGYAPGIAEGRVLRRGEVLGYVGSTGNATPEAPHLHFSIAVLDADKRWHGGTPVNPYPVLTGRPAQSMPPPAVVPSR